MKQCITNTVAGLLALGAFVLGGTASGAGFSLMGHRFQGIRIYPDQVENA